MSQHARMTGLLLLGALTAPGLMARADAISSIRDLGAGVKGLLLNNNGDVAGERPDPSGQVNPYGTPYRGFVDRGGQVTALDPSVFPVHINPNGSVVDGWGPLQNPYGTGPVAVGQDLYPSDPIAGNDKGQVIGTAYGYTRYDDGTDTRNVAGYVYTPPAQGAPAQPSYPYGNGQLSPFQFPATTGIVHETYLNAINNSGTLAGGYMREDQTRAADGTIQYAWSTHAFVGNQDIANLVGTNYSIVTALNDKGDAIGFGLPYNSGAFLYRDGAVTWIPSLNATPPSPYPYSFGGDPWTTLHAINNEDQVVGQVSRWGDHGPYYAAALYDPAKGTTIDLNSLLPKASGWALEDAVGINDAGQIIGYGTFDGQEHGFLLNLDGQIQPIPEPTAMALFCLAGGLFTLRRRKARG